MVEVVRSRGRVTFNFSPHYFYVVLLFICYVLFIPTLHFFLLFKSPSYLSSVSAINIDGSIGFLMNNKSNETNFKRFTELGFNLASTIAELSYIQVSSGRVCFILLFYHTALFTDCQPIAMYHTCLFA